MSVLIINTILLHSQGVQPPYVKVILDMLGLKTERQRMLSVFNPSMSRIAMLS